MIRSKEQILEKESEVALENLLPPEWVLRDKRNPDYALDKELEIVEGGKLTNKVLWLQLKATESRKRNQEKISYQIKTKYLEYYEGCRLPVLILYWIKSENVFYYLFAQKYIWENLSINNPNWRKQKTVTIEFDSQLEKENVDILKSIARAGYLYIIKQQLNIEPGKAYYWFNGILQSDNEELKERVLKALSYFLDAKYFAAIDEFENALRECVTSHTERMSLLLNLGIGYYLISQYDYALQNYNAVLELSKKVSGKSSLKGKLVALVNIGFIFRDRGDLDNAKKCFEDALNICKEIGDKQDEAFALANIGLVYLFGGDLENAKKCLENSLSVYKEIGDKWDEAYALSFIGFIFRDRGDLDNAKKYFEDALKIFKEFGYKHWEAMSLSNIGLIFRDKGDLKNAHKHLENSLNIFKETGYKRDEALALGNIGSVYFNRGDLDNAKKYFEDALKINQEIDYRKGEAVQLNCIGSIYLYRGDLDNAKKYFEDALKICKEFGYKQDEAFALLSVGIVYFAKFDWGDAQKHLENSLNICKEIGYKQGEAFALRFINLLNFLKHYRESFRKENQDTLEIFERIISRLLPEFIKKAFDSFQRMHKKS